MKAGRALARPAFMFSLQSAPIVELLRRFTQALLDE
jgi:hypothetical protein